MYSLAPLLFDFQMLNLSHKILIQLKVIKYLMVLGDHDRNLIGYSCIKKLILNRALIENSKNLFNLINLLN
jgi:hypothetical protein